MAEKMVMTTWNYLDADPYADVQAATIWAPDGGWQDETDGDFDLSNLQTRFLVEAARTATLDPEKTVIHVDFPEERLIQAVVMLGITCSKQATVRVKGYDGYARTTALEHPGADTGPQLVFPRYKATAATPFETRNWWTGQPTEEDLARVPRTWFDMFTGPRFAKHWSLFLDDQGHPDGYFDIGRVMLCTVIRPDINFLYGSQFGWQTDTTKTLSLGGVTFSNYQPPRRVANLTLNHQSKDVAYAIQRMQSRMGTDRSFFACLDPGDYQYRQLLSGQFTFSAMPIMTWDSPNSHSFGTISLEEAL